MDPASPWARSGPRPPSLTAVAGVFPFEKAAVTGRYLREIKPVIFQH